MLNTSPAQPKQTPSIVLVENKNIIVAPYKGHNPSRKSIKFTRKGRASVLNVYAPHGTWLKSQLKKNILICNTHFLPAAPPSDHHPNKISQDEPDCTYPIRCRHCTKVVLPSGLALPTAMRTTTPMPPSNSRRRPLSRYEKKLIHGQAACVLKPFSGLLLACLLKRPLLGGNALNCTRF